MFCQNCGASITEGAKFCPDCGARQEPAVAPAPAQNRCPFCGKLLEADAVFCDNCGKRINGSSQANAPEERDTSFPPPVPPAPEPSRTHRQEETGPGGRRALPIVIAALLVIALLTFVLARYGGSILTRLKPDQGMPADIDIVLTPEPDTEVSAIPKATPEPVEESTPAPEITPEPEDETVSEPLPDSITEPATEPEPESALRYDPLDIETFDPATLADFEWVTYDIAHGMLPTGIDRLESFEEVEGGWKLYIIDDPDGEYGSTMERLCRCAFGEDEDGKGIGIRWDYVHNYGTDEGWEDNSPDSFYYGPWENGVLSALGAGSVTITDFWYADGHEYAAGRMTWPDGIPAVMFLVRP